MSFKCDNCKRSTTHADAHRTHGTEQPIIVVMDTAIVRHPERWREGELIDRGGTGTQIKREIKCCVACAMTLNAAQCSAEGEVSP